MISEGITQTNSVPVMAEALVSFGMSEEEAKYLALKLTSERTSMEGVRQYGN